MTWLQHIIQNFGEIFPPYPIGFEIPRKIGIKSFLLDRKGENTGNFVLKDLKELEEKLTYEFSL